MVSRVASGWHHHLLQAGGNVGVDEEHPACEYCKIKRRDKAFESIAEALALSSMAA
jgi:hypothetical protein